MRKSNKASEQFGAFRVFTMAKANMRSYTKEMCVQSVLSQMSFDFEILVTAEHFEEKEDADVALRYSGTAFDPRTTDNAPAFLRRRPPRTGRGLATESMLK